MHHVVRNRWKAMRNGAQLGLHRSKERWSRRRSARVLRAAGPVRTLLPPLEHWEPLGGVVARAMPAGSSDGCRARYRARTGAATILTIETSTVGLNVASARRAFHEESFAGGIRPAHFSANVDGVLVSVDVWDCGEGGSHAQFIYSGFNVRIALSSGLLDRTLLELLKRGNSGRPSG